MEAIGMIQQAKKAYESALVQWPDNSLALFGLGNTAYAMQDLKAAEKAFRRLYQRQPLSPAVINNLAVILSDLGCYEEAMTIINRGLSFNDTGDPFRQTLVQTREEIIKRKGSQEK